VSYSVRIKASAVKALKRIAADDRRRIVEAIDRLARQPFAGTVLKGEYTGLRRLRVGRYRVVYEVLERQLVVLVVRVGHRRDVYH